MSSSHTPLPHKRVLFKLPNLKLINYKQYKPPKKKIITEEEKKPDIRKLLPYSILSKNFDYIKMLGEDSNSIKEVEKKNIPFITEPELKIHKIKDYNNTLNVVYNSANNEFLLQNNLDNKRRKLEEMLGINDIPPLKNYDYLALKKSAKIKEERIKKMERLSAAQKFAILSRKAKLNRIIDNDMKLLDKFEKKFYKKENIKYLGFG